MKLITSTPGRFPNKQSFRVVAAAQSAEPTVALYQPKPFRVDELGMAGTGNFFLGAKMDDTLVGRGKSFDLFLSCRNTSTCEIARVEVKLVEECHWKLNTREFDLTTFYIELADVDLPGLRKSAKHPSELDEIMKKQNLEEAMEDEVFRDLHADENKLGLKMPKIARNTYEGKLIKISYHIRVALVTTSLEESPHVEIPIIVTEKAKKKKKKKSKDRDTSENPQDTHEKGSKEETDFGKQNWKESLNTDNLAELANTLSAFDHDALEIYESQNDDDEDSSKPSIFDICFDSNDHVGTVDLNYAVHRAIEEFRDAEWCTPVYRAILGHLRGRRFFIHGNDGEWREATAPERIECLGRVFDEIKKEIVAGKKKPKPKAPKSKPKGPLKVPRDQDVCFGSEGHPGTIAFHLAVTECAEKFAFTNWSPPVYKAICSQLPGRRFFIRVEMTWHEANQEERLDLFQEAFEHEREILMTRINNRN